MHTTSDILGLDASPLATRKPRVLEIVRVARGVLEASAHRDISLHRVAELMEIRTPSLYKHVTSKREIEQLLIIEGLWEQAGHAAAAIAEADDRLAALSASYRAWAVGNPALYSLMSSGPLSDDVDTTRAAERGIVILRDLFDGNREHSRWFYVSAHGLVLLEINGRTPADWDLDTMWAQLTDRARRQ